MIIFMDVTAVIKTITTINRVNMFGVSWIDVKNRETMNYWRKIFDEMRRDYDFIIVGKWLRSCMFHYHTDDLNDQRKKWGKGALSIAYISLIYILKVYIQENSASWADPLRRFCNSDTKYNKWGFRHLNRKNNLIRW